MACPDVPFAPLRRERPAALPAGGVLAWLPFLWTRVLFPGPTPDAGPWQWRPAVGLFVLCGALLYPCLSFRLFEPDEGRYAQIPAEMLARGDWVVPTLQGEPYLDKPPLFYWLVMLAYGAFGVHDWAARLVPAGVMHAGVLATYGLGRRLVGERGALWGALLLTVSPLYLGMGRLLLLDGLLTLWVTVAVLCALLAQRGPALHRGWWLAAATACGLGVLTKGPVAVVLLLGPLLVERGLHRGRARIAGRDWLTFAAVVLGLGLPWYAAACARLPAFARHFLWEHNVLRFVQPFDHERPVWFYGPILLVGLLPVTLLLPWWYRFLVAGDTARRRFPEMGSLLLFGGGCVLFFSLSGCKLPTYVLPAFAPLCLAAGAFVAERWAQPRGARAVVAVCVAAVAGSHYVFVPWYAAQKTPLTDPAAVAEMCGDPRVPVVCFPRNVDSVAFYVGRADFHTFRSKDLGPLLDFLDRQPRAVVLFGHRNSPGVLRRNLPPHLTLTDVRPLGLCEMAVVERVAGR